jgi:acetyl-CoA acetyltransferase
VRDVYILGTGMTAFGRHPLGSAPKLVRDSATAALRDAGCTFADVDAVYMAACHPASPRGIYVAKELGLTGIPLQHIENASATGLAAVHEAALAIRSGAADVVAVLSFDAPDRPLPVEEVIAQEGHIPAVALFGMWARRRMHDCGTTERHLALVAAKNWNYARDNPLAGRRSAQPVTADTVLNSRTIAAPLRSMMCTSWGEGAAAAILASAEGARRIGAHTDGARTAIRLAGTAMRTEEYAPGHLLAGSMVGPPEITEKTARAAMEQAGAGPRDLDVVQVHDAFAVEELIYCELLGMSQPGETESLLERGAFGPGSRRNFGVAEVSTDGGLIARGHPGGPTGVAQVHETVRRLRAAGDDRVGLCHLVGTGSVCAVQVYVREERAAWAA